MKGDGGSASAIPGTYRRVVVGVDDSDGGLAALRYAVSMARARHSQLVAVRCWDIGLPRHGGRRNRRGSHHGMLLFYNGVQQRMASGHLVSDVFRAVLGGVPPDLAVTISTPEGDPGVVLTRIAETDGDVLVVGTEPGTTPGAWSTGRSASTAATGHDARLWWCRRLLKNPAVRHPGISRQTQLLLQARPR